MPCVKEFRDTRGRLQVVEPSFPVMRTFVISEVPKGAMRGGHAHKTCEQVIWCVRGSFTLNGRMVPVGVAVHCPPRTWIELRDFTEDAVAVVLCSHKYNPSDVIHDLRELGSSVQ